MLLNASVIILTWNSDAYLDNCLSALLQQRYPPVEIIVVDNASTDRSVQIAQHYQPTIRLICNDYNYGFAGGMNMGIQAATGDVVVLLNPDTVVFEGWLEAVIKTFEAPQAGIVGCKAWYPQSRRLQHAGATVNPVDAFTTHLGQGEEDQGQHDRVVDVEYVTGAAFAIHRRVIEKIGLLDEQFYPAFYEEIDYCYRARNAGFSVIYQPEALLYHHETPSLSTQSYQRFATFHRNRIRLILRHWSADAFKAFICAERDALKMAGLTDEVIARRYAYWHNACLLSQFGLQRQENAWVGEPLSKGQVYWLGEALIELQTVATQRVLTLIEESHTVAPMVHGVNRPKRQPGDVRGGPETASQQSQTADHVATLRSLLHEIDAQHFLKEYQFTSTLPIVGKAVAGFRSLWLSVATRWYVRPALRQQSEINTKLVQAVTKAVELIEAQDQMQKQTQEQTEQLLTEIQQQLVQNQTRHEQLQEFLQKDDVVSLQAVWALFEKKRS